jgi:hypothetical protein
MKDAIRHFNERHSLLDLFPDLRRAASTNGGEWAGPCPLCGGRDRLRVWPEPREGFPRAWCRQCKASGDALAWATRRAGRDPGVKGAMYATLREDDPLAVAPIEQRRLVRTPASQLSLAAWLVSLPGWAREMFEERAAIMEFDGGLARDEAEGRARVEVAKRLGEIP